MTERWQAVRRVFERALALPESERTAFVAAACGDDAALHREVVELLETATSSAVGYLEPPSRGELAASLERRLAAPELTGQRVGSYRLGRVVAAGGMGVVFEAEQENPRRRVAVKMMRLGLDSEDHLRRFRYESEVLAGLRHPGIAHVYEAAGAAAALLVGRGAGRGPGAVSQGRADQRPSAERALPVAHLRAPPPGPGHLGGADRRRLDRGGRGRVAFGEHRARGPTRRDPRARAGQRAVRQSARSVVGVSVRLPEARCGSGGLDRAASRHAREGAREPRVPRPEIRSPGRSGGTPAARSGSPATGSGP